MSLNLFDHARELVPIAQEKETWENEMVQKLTTIGDLYDALMYRPQDMGYYDQSDFYNFGYWAENTRGQKEACANLMDQLLSLIPEKRGTVLDVACGKGATTQYLLRYFQPSDVVAINISERQLQTARANAPDCQYFLMDAVSLGFGGELFDNIICVEAAFHFDTREKFLHEAYRVLKPGGYLVLSDIVHARISKRNRYIPAGNLVKDLDTYTSAYRRAGFQDIRIIDATNECWRGFRWNFLRWRVQKVITRAGAMRDAAGTLIWLFLLSMIVKRYLLVSARKG